MFKSNYYYASFLIRSESIRYNTKCIHFNFHNHYNNTRHQNNLELYTEKEQGIYSQCWYIYRRYAGIFIVARIHRICCSCDFNRLSYTFSAGIIEAITGLMFAYKSLIADSPLVKWKGRFFLLSILFLISGVLLDGVFVGEYLLLKMIIRLFLVASSILYYFGFFLPKKFSNRLCKE